MIEEMGPQVFEKNPKRATSVATEMSNVSWMNEDVIHALEHINFNLQAGRF